MTPAFVIAVLVVAFGSAAVGLIGVVRASTRHAPEEAGLVPRYSTRGGGVFGFIRVSAPLVRISVYSRFVVIAGLSTYVIPVELIREVSLVRVLFGQRIRLVHTSPAAPSPIVLWANPLGALAAALREVATNRPRADAPTRGR